MRFADESMCLGHGEYGDVYRGTIKRKHVEETVAVKVINLNGSKTNHENHLSLQSFISEIKILQYIGLHKNIIAMKGAYTAKLQTGRVSIFLEICELGSIEKYLKSINTQGPVPQELFKNLERWAVEIADGMEFLVGKKVNLEEIFRKKSYVFYGFCKLLNLCRWSMRTWPQEMSS